MVTTIELGASFRWSPIIRLRHRCSSKGCGEPLPIVKLNTLPIAVNHDAPLTPEECKRDE